MAKNDWTGMDHDDINGYLTDFLHSEFDISDDMVSPATHILTEQELVMMMGDSEWTWKILNNIRQALEEYDR